MAEETCHAFTFTSQFGLTQALATMYIVLELPDVKVNYNVFGNFWLKSMFGGGLPSDPEVQVLASTFVRLVEAAIREYNMGVAGTRQYWGTHDKIALGAIQQATSHFEACVSDMHRAVNCFTRLRRHRNIGSLSGINDQRPSFVSASVHDQLRNARNEIHHMEELVMKGGVTQGRSSAIHADGPEIIHPSEPGQTIKTIDRLSVGNCELLVQDIASWLLEMAKFCEVMGNGERQPPGVMA
jgi:hypothetical protein